jgi:hypothetical protein
MYVFINVGYIMDENNSISRDVFILMTNVYNQQQLTLYSSLFYRLFPSVTSQAYLPQSANITGQACVLWYICYSFDMGVSNDICSMLTSVDGTSACPDAGSYSFSNTLTSPGSSSWELPSWLQGYSFTVTLNIVEDDGMSKDTMCVAKIKTASTSSSGSAAAAAVAVSLVAAVSWVSMSIWRKKQRRILLNNDMTTNPEGDSTTKKASLLELATQSQVTRHMV